MDLASIEEKIKKHSCYVDACGGPGDCPTTCGEYVAEKIDALCANLRASEERAGKAEKSLCESQARAEGLRESVKELADAATAYVCRPAQGKSVCDKHKQDAEVRFRKALDVVRFPSPISQELEARVWDEAALYSAPNRNEAVTREVEREQERLRDIFKARAATCRKKVEALRGGGKS